MWTGLLRHPAEDWNCAVKSLVGRLISRYAVGGLKFCW